MRTVKTWALVQSDDTATSEDAHLTPPSHWLPGRGTLYGGRAGRGPLSLNAGDTIVTVLALVSSSACEQRALGSVLRAIACAMTTRSI